MNNGYLQVIAYYYAKQGMGEHVNQALIELAAATRTEPDNLSYQFFRSTENSDHFVILEQYQTANGLEAHRQTEHFQRIGVSIITPLLDSKQVESIFVTQGNNSLNQGVHQ
ncbi:putative quinol monooxygenase [Providencia manganoxydans]|uniref:putative quinol monooxygenase n=1 Tax=Providencia manganoxydans TaxID=2923283 RepID=UPI00294082CC|nr:antibiotic biosynthesis monooxygenase [Providencia stuartii]ELR5081431.1 antibiotic biosynthesis monooxygenase [Providencia stuartii]